MDLHTFAETVSAVLEVALDREIAIADQASSPFYPAAVELLTSIDAVDLGDFISVADVDGAGVAISVAGKPYVIKEDAAKAKDPAVHTPDGWLVSNSAYTFVAVELAHWLRRLAPATYQHSRFDIYYGIRAIYTTLVKDTYYSNKLWLADSGETYVATVADLAIVIVGRSTTSLASVLQVLGVESPQ